MNPDSSLICGTDKEGNVRCLAKRDVLIVTGIREKSLFAVGNRMGERVQVPISFEPGKWQEKLMEVMEDVEQHAERD